MMSFRLLACLLAFTGVQSTLVTISYNDDMQCGEPFEGFQVESVICSSSKSSSSNRYNSVDSDQNQNTCRLGDTMQLQGSVTLSEAVYSSFNVRIELCNGDYYGQQQDNQGNNNNNRRRWNSWGSSCKSYSTTLDLPSEEGYGSSWLEQGNHNWQASVKLPSARSVFLSGGGSTTAIITFRPKKTYNREDGTTSTYKSWQCVGTLGSEETEYVRSYYAAAGAVLVAVGATAAYLSRKRRIASIDASKLHTDDDVGESSSPKTLEIGTIA